MTLTQERLLRETALRVRAARPDLAARHDLSDVASLAALKADVDKTAAAAAQDDVDVAAVVVLRRLDPAAWIRGTCAFAQGLDPERAAAWRRSFTRTVFLAGNPDNLRERFAFDHIADDLSAAWSGPASDDQLRALRRLLKGFSGSRELPPPPALPIVVPGAADPGRPAVRRELHVATAGGTVADAMIHINHLLVEAVLDGLVRPGDELVLRRAPRLTGITGPLAAIRASAEPARPDRLQAFACLTERIVDVRNARKP